MLHASARQEAAQGSRQRQQDVPSSNPAELCHLHISPDRCDLDSGRCHHYPRPCRPSLALLYLQHIAGSGHFHLQSPAEERDEVRRLQALPPMAYEATGQWGYRPEEEGTAETETGIPDQELLGQPRNLKPVKDSLQSSDESTCFFFFPRAFLVINTWVPQCQALDSITFCSKQYARHVFVLPDHPAASAQLL